MNNCPFCQIAAAAPGGFTVLESELAVAFLDIRPIRPGHVLIIPKRHEADFWALTQEEQHEMLALANRLADAQKKLFNPVKIGLLVAGFEIPHAHLHVVPLHEIQDLTSESILKGTIKPASADDLVMHKSLYAQHFLSQD